MICKFCHQSTTLINLTCPHCGTAFPSSQPPHWFLDSYDPIEKKEKIKNSNKTVFRTKEGSKSGRII